MEHYSMADIPQQYREKVVPPVRVESHVDHSAQASKSHGFDRDGRRCYYRHAFTLSEQRFDADEFPLEVDVYEEQVLAWRLTDGSWLKLKVASDQLDHCRKRIRQGTEITALHALEA
jgi:hypothetical protein